MQDVHSPSHTLSDTCKRKILEIEQPTFGLEDDSPQSTETCELPVTDNSLSEKTVTSWICTSNTAADMNTKLVVAVLFALVSVSLCEIPAPSQELVTKYDDYKATFYRRLLNLYEKLQQRAAPLVESAGSDDRFQVFKDFAEDLQTKPEFQAVVKVAGGLGAEVGPLVDSARTSALGAYEHYLRPYIGEQLSDAITDVKGYLDKFLPAE